MNGYFDAMLRYFELSGRTSRAQYWIFQLFNLALLAGAFWLDGTSVEQLRDRQFGFATCFVLFVHIVPQVTVTVRRLHDSGRSGWAYFIGMIPFGSFVLLYWMCQASEPGGNAYGPDPHDPAPPGPAEPASPGLRLPAFGRTGTSLADITARRASFGRDAAG
jgi:uncharacterized membrane protein YhaH (DUF805 family)